jgi:hypothetical protein
MGAVEGRCEMRRCELGELWRAGARCGGVSYGKIGTGYGV